jgi:ABC-type uncharacterized transport system permease subunit
MSNQYNEIDESIIVGTVVIATAATALAITSTSVAAVKTVAAVAAISYGSLLFAKECQRVSSNYKAIVATREARDAVQKNLI